MSWGACKVDLTGLGRITRRSSFVASQGFAVHSDKEIAAPHLRACFWAPVFWTPKRGIRGPRPLQDAQDSLQLDRCPSMGLARQYCHRSKGGPFDEGSEIGRRSSLDRHPLWLDAMEKLLRVGVEVVGRATDGDEAVALIEEHRPDVFIAGIDPTSSEQMACVRKAPAEPPGSKSVVVADRHGARGDQRCIRSGRNGLLRQDGGAG